jgi:hypothetical protein
MQTVIFHSKLLSCVLSVTNTLAYYKICTLWICIILKVLYGNDLDCLLIFASTPTSLLSFKIKCLHFPSL